MAFPIIILLAIGAADYARIYYTSVTVANAAKAGVHYGIENDGDVALMKYAAQLDAGSVTLDSVTAGQYCRCPATGVVSCTGVVCDGYGVPQTFDSVRVRKDVTMLIRYLGLPSKVTVARTVIMREN